MVAVIIKWLRSWCDTQEFLNSPWYEPQPWGGTSSVFQVLISYDILYALLGRFQSIKKTAGGMWKSTCSSMPIKGPWASLIYTQLTFPRGSWFELKLVVPSSFPMERCSLTRPWWSTTTVHLSKFRIEFTDSFPWWIHFEMKVYSQSVKSVLLVWMLNVSASHHTFLLSESQINFACTFRQHLLTPRELGPKLTHVN